MPVCACMRMYVPVCVCVCMWSTFHKIKDDIDSVTSRERAVGNDSCLFNRCPEEEHFNTLCSDNTALRKKLEISAST